MTIKWINRISRVSYCVYKFFSATSWSSEHLTGETFFIHSSAYECFGWRNSISSVSDSFLSNTLAHTHTTHVNATAVSELFSYRVRGNLLIPAERRLCAPIPNTNSSTQRQFISFWFVDSRPVACCVNRMNWLRRFHARAIMLNVIVFLLLICVLFKWPTVNANNDSFVVCSSLLTIRDCDCFCRRMAGA